MSSDRGPRQEPVRKGQKNYPYQNVLLSSLARRPIAERFRGRLLRGHTSFVTAIDTDRIRCLKFAAWAGNLCICRGVEVCFRLSYHKHYQEAFARACNAMVGPAFKAKLCGSTDSGYVGCGRWPLPMAGPT